LLHFTPVVLGDGRIRLKIDPEVSDLDYSHGVSIAGFTIPGFTTRTVDTTVELADGQTFTIAGLLSDQVTATSNTTPGLGDMPILGALFRSVQYQRNQTELVVMVTPRLVEGINPDQVLPARASIGVIRLRPICSSAGIWAAKQRARAPARRRAGEGRRTTAAVPRQLWVYAHG
jgi:Flp pilus assembly secretin CpaC